MPFEVHKQLFDDEEMTSDPAPKAPTVTLKEVTEEDEKREEGITRANEWFNSNKVTRVPVIALEPDIYQIPEQKFACFSVIRPEDYGVLHHGDKSYKGFLIKFRGVFPDREEADKHIRKIMKTDRHFDIHLVPCFQWSQMEDDNPEDREHIDTSIGDIIKGYFKEENNRMKGIRTRIRNTEESTGRSQEASEFYDSAMAADVPLLPDKPSNAKPVSLEQLAGEMEIKPKGEAILSQAMDENDTRIDAIVSEVILEEEEEEPKEEPKICELSGLAIEE